MRTDDPSRPRDESTEPPSDDSLERYFAGRCTPTEESAVHRWLGADPVRMAYAQTIARELATGMPRFEVEAMLDCTRRHIDEGERRRKSSWRQLVTIRVALPAAAVLLLAVALTSYVRSTSRDGANRAVVAAREVVTKRGQQEVVDLADGSRVVLAPGSRLSIPGDFNMDSRTGARRDVQLEGKAFFRVQHDAKRPFRVRTTTAVAEDLGTEFIVRAYPEGRTTQIVVVAGAVAMDRVAPDPRSPDAIDRPLLRLEPGDVAEMDAKGAVTLERNVNVTDQMSWTTGVLMLDAVRLEDALAELGRWYDVEFKVNAREMDSTRVSGEFRTESVDVAMQRLGLMLGLRATRDGRTVVLSSLSTR